MVNRTDFTPEEWKLICDLPFVVAGTSLAIIHSSVFKAMKTAISIYAIVFDTSKRFPDNECIQKIFVSSDKSPQDHDQHIEKHQSYGKEAAVALRNDMSKQVISILSQKCQPQEFNEYRQWILQISYEVMQKAESDGFLGLNMKSAEAEVTQALRDFEQVLQIAE